MFLLRVCFVYASFQSILLFPSTNAAVPKVLLGCWDRGEYLQGWGKCPNGTAVIVALLGPRGFKNLSGGNNGLLGEVESLQPTLWASLKPHIVQIG